jgi:RES domain-containing protein
MIEAWRIVPAEYATAAFTGEGARLYGGRWHNPGIPVVYVAGCISLALVEILVHLELSVVPTPHRLFKVKFPEELVQEVDRAALGPNWRRIKPTLELRKLGDAWLKSSPSAALRVPSKIVPSERAPIESNYLLNPGHKGFSKVHIEPDVEIDIDLRLIEPRHPSKI